jgi:hypothetical protein
MSDSPQALLLSGYVAAGAAVLSVTSHFCRALHTLTGEVKVVANPHIAELLGSRKLLIAKLLIVQNLNQVRCVESECFDSRHTLHAHLLPLHLHRLDRHVDLGALVLKTCQVRLIVHQHVPKVEVVGGRALNKSTERLKVVLEIDRCHVVETTSLRVGARSLSIIELVLDDLTVPEDHKTLVKGRTEALCID